MKKYISLTTTLCLLCTGTAAQHIYQLNAPTQEKTIHTGHLKLGGTSPDGGRIEVNSFYMSQNGIPTIPVMGEFHYCRYPREQWEEAILKMKAGGLTVIPTYIFWNIHEEREGIFNWSGNRDVRSFIQLCHKYGMKVLVRIGPFCHGEIRNGGLPDWLFARPVEVRTDDPVYLKYVDRLYKQIATQLTGLYYKDGGPIIGTQIENELQHSAAPWAIFYQDEPVDRTAASYDASTVLPGVGVQTQKISREEQGNRHMITLKRMAEAAGIITPLYTATGWGMAAVIGNEAIPVTAAYTYPTWTPADRKSPFCLFKDIQHNPDYSPVRYDGDKYPSFCAEMGVGIQMTYPRRCIVKDAAAEALMVRTLGSGANGIGYYMFHGGSTPKQQGGVGFFSEEPGCPKISYDFQAPIGEFGQVRDSYRYLRLLHLFVNAFGNRLAPMETILPEGYEQITPDNHETLRFAARMKQGAGFIFMTNFQDHDTTRTDQKDLQLQLNLNSEVLRIPTQGTFTLKKDVSAILPFNFAIEDALLKYATAQPLTLIEDDGHPHYIFFAPEGIAPEFCFDQSTLKSGRKYYHPQPGTKSTFHITTRSGKKVYITTLTRQQAMHTSLLDNRILITQATVLPHTDGFTLLSLGKNKMDYILYPSRNGWKQQHVEVDSVNIPIESRAIGGRRLAIRIQQPEKPQVNEYFLKINYVADVAMAFINGSMVLDQFYHGAPWLIGLKRFKQQLQMNGEMNFYFRPLSKNASFLNDLPSSAIPDFGQQNKLLHINNIEIIPEYKVNIRY